MLHWWPEVPKIVFWYLLTLSLNSQTAMLLSPTLVSSSRSWYTVNMLCILFSHNVTVYVEPVTTVYVDIVTVDSEIFDLKCFGLLWTSIITQTWEMQLTKSNLSLQITVNFCEFTACSKISCYGEEACTSHQGGGWSDDGELNYFPVFFNFYCCFFPDPLWYLFTELY